MPPVVTDTPAPLAGVRALDLSTLVPGPLASLILASATVIKIERTGTGDDMRLAEPRIGRSSVVFGMLNRGKRCYSADLKDPGSAQRCSRSRGTATCCSNSSAPASPSGSASVTRPSGR